MADFFRLLFCIFLSFFLSSADSFLFPSRPESLLLTKSLFFLCRLLLFFLRRLELLRRSRLRSRSRLLGALFWLLSLNPCLNFWFCSWAHMKRSACRHRFLWRVLPPFTRRRFLFRRRLVRLSTTLWWWRRFWILFAIVLMLKC